MTLINRLESLLKGPERSSYLVSTEDIGRIIALLREGEKMSKVIEDAHRQADRIAHMARCAAEVEEQFFRRRDALKQHMDAYCAAKGEA